MKKRAPRTFLLTFIDSNGSGYAFDCNNRGEVDQRNMPASTRKILQRCRDGTLTPAVKQGNISKW